MFDLIEVLYFCLVFNPFYVFFYWGHNRGWGYFRGRCHYRTSRGSLKGPTLTQYPYIETRPWFKCTSRGPTMTGGFGQRAIRGPVGDQGWSFTYTCMFWLTPSHCSCSPPTHQHQLLHRRLLMIRTTLLPEAQEFSLLLCYFVLCYFLFGLFILH